MPYLTPEAAGLNNGITRAYVIRLAKAGRIPGAEKVGRHWIIPESWTYTRERRTSNKDTTK